MKILKYFLLAAFIGILSNSVSNSQTIEITLKDAIRHAYDSNPTIKKTENTIDAQESNIRASYGNLFPDLTFSGGWTRTNQVTEAGTIFNNGINIPVDASNETTNNYNLSLRSNVTLFDGFANMDNIDVYKHTKIQYQIQLQKLKQDIALKILASYIQVLKNEQIVAISDSTLRNSQAQLERIKIFVEVGRRTLTDIYTQDVQVAQNELALEQAKNNLNKSISDLAFNSTLPLDRNYAVNRNEFNIALSYETLEQYVSQNSNAEALTIVARKNRRDLKGTTQNLDILQTRLEIARSTMIFPTLSGFGSYSLSGREIGNISNQRVFTVGLTLSYPIFSGFQYDNQRQQAAINLLSAKEDIRQLENQISLEIKKAILDLKSLLKQIEITDRSVRSAEQNRTLAEESYRVGIGTLLDVNTASINLNNLLITKSNLIYDFIYAQKQLEYYQGLLNY
jgi:outer membrane protein